LNSRAGAVLYLTLLLAWVVLVFARRRGSARTSAEPVPETRTLVLFVTGWAIILMSIAIAWWLFHRP
jgi:hypothetical protein